MTNILIQLVKKKISKKKDKHNVNRKTRNLKENSIVYLKSNDKFKPKHTRPYEVIEKCNPFHYFIRIAGDVRGQN